MIIITFYIIFDWIHYDDDDDDDNDSNEKKRFDSNVNVTPVCVCVYDGLESDHQQFSTKTTKKKIT